MIVVSQYSKTPVLPGEKDSMEAYVAERQPQMAVFSFFKKAA